MIDKWICLMVIQPNAWSVGSLTSTDPNAQSFHSPNWQHSEGRRSSPHEVVSVEDDVVSIASHPPYNQEHSSENFRLISAISFNQTQDGFLKKVQEALQRMGELSVLAQSESKTDVERLTYTTEFTQLQYRIREIETKMFKAAVLFKPIQLETALKPETSTDKASEESSLSKLELNEFLDSTSDPEVIGINNTQNATAAIDAIHVALEAVAGFRARVHVDIQRLNTTGEQLSALDLDPSERNLQIKDTNVAEASTQFVRYDILVKSGTAMLAQANAIPQSALRLLG